MANTNYILSEISADTFRKVDNLNISNTSLLETQEINTLFDKQQHFIEFTVYDSEDNLIHLDQNYTNYKISGIGPDRLNIEPIEDVKKYKLADRDTKVIYKFFENTTERQNTSENYYITKISEDRTELELALIKEVDNSLEHIVDDLKSKLDTVSYQPELTLYKQDGTCYKRILNVTQYEDKEVFYIKLNTPLESIFDLTSSFSILNKVAEPIAYEIIIEEIQEEERVPILKSPNFNIDLENPTADTTNYYNYNELFSYPTNSSYKELRSLFQEKSIEISIDYSDYSNFIQFSSAGERLRNFKYKLDLIFQYEKNLDTVTNTIIQNTSIKSKSYYENLINGIINNFDHYERHLYYSKEDSAWPKINTFDKPYILHGSYESTKSRRRFRLDINAWYQSKLEEADQFDLNNIDKLTNTIPSFIQDDPANSQYGLFVDMVGQHFDNIWIYSKAVTDKYDADNRMNYGISRELVQDVLKNFGVKIHNSGNTTADLFKYFTKNEYNEGKELITDNFVLTGRQVSLQEYEQEIYKRVYHNLPLLLKSKGTERGLRALINCFGIPSETLSIKVYGGQSALDAPFYGGEEAFTSNQSKVRITEDYQALADAAGVDNDPCKRRSVILSPLTATEFTEYEITADQHRIEVGFSPSDNIDKYIVSQSQTLFPNETFNIDNYIGDPREVNAITYSQLDNYKKTILEGLDRYDIKDFIRLIKFFDNVLFRMIHDFVPARAVTDTGIIIKSHILERNKYSGVTPSGEDNYNEYEVNLNVSREEPNAESKHGDTFKLAPNTNSNLDPTTPLRPITTTTLSNLKNRQYTAPNLTSNHPIDIPGESTTSHKEQIQTPDGIRVKDFSTFQDQPKYNGELAGSRIKIVDGELNSENPFKQVNYPLLGYSVSFFKDPFDVCNYVNMNYTSPYIFATRIAPTDSSTTVSASGFDIYSNTAFFSDHKLFLGTDDTGIDITEPGFELTGDGTYTQYQEIDTFASGGVGCTAGRKVKVVYCDIEKVDYNPTIVMGSVYNITEYFTVNSNTDGTYYYDGVTPLDATAVNIPYDTNKEGQTVSIEYTDNFDTGCTQTVTGVLITCPLTGNYTVSYTYQDKEIGGTTISRTKLISDLPLADFRAGNFELHSVSGTRAYSFADLFTGQDFIDHKFFVEFYRYTVTDAEGSTTTNPKVNLYVDEDPISTQGAITYGSTAVELDGNKIGIEDIDVVQVPKEYTDIPTGLAHYLKVNSDKYTDSNGQAFDISASNTTASFFQKLANYAAARVNSSDKYFQPYEENFLCARFYVKSLLGNNCIAVSPYLNLSSPQSATTTGEVTTVKIRVEYYDANNITTLSSISSNTRETLCCTQRSGDDVIITNLTYVPVSEFTINSAQANSMNNNTDLIYVNASSPYYKLPIDRLLQDSSKKLYAEGSYSLTNVTSTSNTNLEVTKSIFTSGTPSNAIPSYLLRNLNDSTLFIDGIPVKAEYDLVGDGKLIKLYDPNLTSSAGTTIRCSTTECSVDTQDPSTGTSPDQPGTIREIE